VKVVVDINHPAHVHLFKNFIRQMESNGHGLLITASEKDVAPAALDNYGFKYDRLGVTALL
jgi:predicted glycosyltransferase